MNCDIDWEDEGDADDGMEEWERIALSNALALTAAAEVELGMLDPFSVPGLRVAA
jgi:hypothetical protein